MHFRQFWRLTKTTKLNSWRNFPAFNTVSSIAIPTQRLWSLTEQHELPGRPLRHQNPKNTTWSTSWMIRLVRKQHTSWERGTHPFLWPYGGARLVTVVSFMTHQVQSINERRSVNVRVLLPHGRPSLLSDHPKYQQGLELGLAEH